MKEFRFRRIVLIAILFILALVAVGSLVVILTGVVTDRYPLAAGAAVPLSSSGGLSLLAWRTYAANPPG